MLSQLFKKQTPMMVGIDIGSHSVKAVLLSKQHERYTVEAFAVEPMPKGVVSEREIQDIDAVASVIAKVRKKIPKNVQYAVAAVSGSTVISKVIYMDVNLNDEDLAGQIEIEADSLIPYPLNEVSLDFEKLCVNEADPSKVNVLLSAARTESIEARVETLESGGFEAKVIDVECFALSRAGGLCLSQIDKDEQNKVIGLIDIGANMTLFTVIANSEGIYSRDQMFGGDQYTQSIVAYYNKSFEEAERAKVTNDMPPNYTFEVLAPFQTMLLQQVRRAIQMFVTTSGKDNLDYIIVSGGSSLIEGIDQLLIEELGIHTVVANPFVNMDIGAGINQEQLQKQQSQLVVACGLALRSFVEWHI
ncbi:MAG: type IV pilus assembly protein PilM [Alteromonadaceae bacterium]|jgi:type IV pilus assembly protein PilM